MRVVADTRILAAAAMLALPAAWGMSADDVRAELARPVLDDEARLSSWRTVFAEVKKADEACDAAWRRLGTPAELQSYGRELRGRMIRALGGFPERCPLNARTTSTWQGDGYKVENVVFESWPGVHVTGNLYLPDAKRFSSPHPCVLVSCGHSGAGKASRGYARGGVMSAQAGVAALVLDPFGQGERLQGCETAARNPMEHNRIGSLAVLLGGGFPRFRVWDAMRALDYLETRSDIDAAKFGCMGNSGGGNVTAFLQVVDPRLSATAPAGYICSYSCAAEKASIGPGDACQNIFGQLAIGLNHASFCLMAAPLPIRVEAYRGDIVFPFDGTQHTVELVAGVMSKMGWGDRFSMTDMEGGHNWYEGSRASSVDWMRRWLLGESAALGRTTADYRALNVGFDLKSADCGPDSAAGRACGGNGVLSLPGERTAYDVMRGELKAAVAARKGPPSAADVRRIAVIGEPGALCLRRDELAQETKEGVRIVREVYTRPDGLKLPAVTFIPSGAKGAPVVVLDADSRTNCAALVAARLAEGRPVMSVDLTGAGEIGAMRKAYYSRYYGRDGRDEELAVLLYALGKSLVGRQAEELQAVAADAKERFGAAPDVVARGRICVAAAHACAANERLFGDVAFAEPPPSWSESVERSLDVPMSICVNGALLAYDWPGLSPRAKILYNSHQQKQTKEH